MTALCTVVLILGTAYACACVGHLLFRYSLRVDQPVNPALETGASYFIGIAVFLFLWRILECLPFNAQLSLGITLVVFGICVFLDSLFKRLRHIVLMFLVVTGVSFAIAIYWIDFQANYFGAYAHIGSLHTGRYANLALHIARENRIPVVGQSFEQSLLASYPLLLGLNHPALALYLWLCVSHVALALMTYGSLVQLGLSFRRAVVGTGIILLGQTTLSVTHTVVIDSNSPLLLMGYSDSVRSLGGFAIFLAILWAFEAGIARRVAGPVLGAVWFGWGAQAPQNIFLAMSILLFLIARSLRRSPTYLLGISVLGCLTTLVSLPLGGLMTPERWREPVRVHGIRNGWHGPTRVDAFVIKPQVPYVVFGKYGPDQALPVPELTLSKLCREGLPRPVSWWLYQAENQLWHGLKILFFPVLGFFGLGLVKKSAVEEKVWKFALLAFGMGGFVVFLFTVNGLRWEWTRLMIPGYSLGMTCLVLLLRRARGLTWLIILCLAGFGPARAFSSRLVIHLHNPALFLEKMKVMISLNQTIPTSPQRTP